MKQKMDREDLNNLKGLVNFMRLEPYRIPLLSPVNGLFRAVSREPLDSCLNFQSIDHSGKYLNFKYGYKYTIYTEIISEEPVLSYITAQAQLRYLMQNISKRPKGVLKSVKKYPKIKKTKDNSLFEECKGFKIDNIDKSTILQYTHGTAKRFFCEVNVTAFYDVEQKITLS